MREVMFVIVIDYHRIPNLEQDILISDIIIDSLLYLTLVVQIYGILDYFLLSEK